MSPDAEPVGRTLLVAGLCGFCAGAIEVCDGPVYVRKVDELRGRGATFVEESASAMEILVREVVGYARGSLGVSAVREFKTVEQDVSFSLPSELKAQLPAMSFHP